MYKKVCFLCNAKKLKKILDFGLQPWCNNFLKKKQLGLEKKFLQKLFKCAAWVYFKKKYYVF